MDITRYDPDKVIIIGAGNHAILMEQLEKEFGEHVTLITPNEARALPNLSEIKSHMLKQRGPIPLGTAGSSKPFICKGKHRYERHETKKGNLTVVEWICQCKRKTTD